MQKKSEKGGEKTYDPQLKSSNISSSVEGGAWEREAWIIDPNAYLRSPLDCLTCISKLTGLKSKLRQMTRDLREKPEKKQNVSKRKRWSIKVNAGEKWKWIRDQIYNCGIPSVLDKTMMGKEHSRDGPQCMTSGISSTKPQGIMCIKKGEFDFLGPWRAVEVLASRGTSVQICTMCTLEMSF